MMVAVVILLVLTGVFKALSDKSSEDDIYWGNPMWWNKTFSSNNKYKDYNLDGRKTPRFFGSTTFLVFLTDFWHLSNFLGSACYQLTIVMLLNNVYNFGFWKGVLIFVLLKGGIGAIGEITKRVINKAK